MPRTVHSEILSSLASVREDVRRHVEELDRYRAVKAIEKTIADFPALDDLTGSLTDIRDSMQQRLSETREYRALCVVEKMMPELTSVLALLSERSDDFAPQAPAVDEEPADASASAPDDNVPADAPSAVAADAIEWPEIDETSAFAAVATGSLDESRAVEDRSDVGDPIPDDPDFEPLRGESADYSSPPNPLVEQQTSPPPAGEGAPASSLAYSLAQLMVQALVPPSAMPSEGAHGEKKEITEPVVPTDHSVSQHAGRAA